MGTRDRLTGRVDGSRETVRPLLVTADEDLLEAVLRVAATVHVEIDVEHSPPRGRALWSAAPLVLVGSDALANLADGAPPRRPGTVVVRVTQDDADGDRSGGLDVWRAAVTIGAEHVAELPAGDAWLAHRLSDLASEQVQAELVGVLGGCGGVGASTLSAALAVAGARRGAGTLLVDADPAGGGIDLLLGAEDEPGSRWPDLAEAQGRVAPATLREVLPVSAGVHLLSAGRQDLGPAGDPASRPVEVTAVDAVLEGAARGFELVVVDLSRSLDAMTSACLRHLSAVFLVVPARVRPVAAAGHLLHRLEEWPVEVRLVLRGPAPGGLAADDLERVLRRPVAAVLPDEPTRPADEERGEPPGVNRRSRLARGAGDLLEVLGAVSRTGR